VTILPYERRVARFHEWDPRTEEVAALVSALVGSVRPDLVVEHIGSTAVPTLPGKGIVDLSTEADPAEIPMLTQLLHGLGFQPQPGPDPWPPTRPMLVGAVIHDGEEFRIHLHLQPRGGTHPRDIAFRDALRTDPQLLAEYTDLKRRITAAGTVDAFRYTHSKTSWILGVYKRLGFQVPAILPPAVSEAELPKPIARMTASKPSARRSSSVNVAWASCPCVAWASRPCIPGASRPRSAQPREPWHDRYPPHDCPCRDCGRSNRPAASGAAGR
jgi:GrpB-like predicted nucleotidyltransferase (UPF0157 family)